MFILFTNPGGILQAMGEDSSTGGINISDLLFFMLTICFLSASNKSLIFLDTRFKIIFKNLVVFLIYYLVVFGFFIPQLKDITQYQLFTTIIKMRFAIYNILLVLFVYYFYLRSNEVFFKYFIISSLIVMSLFFITILSGIDILPLRTMDRNFIQISRLLMVSYGLLPILIPMGIIILSTKFKFKWKNAVLFSSLLMYIIWILSLLRREIFGAIILFLFAGVLINYIRGKNLIPTKKIFKLIVYLSIVILVLKISFPNYIDAGLNSAIETYQVFRFGKSSLGNKDVRLGFGKKELQEKIKDNYIVGTGFDNRWRISQEDGFEASDYPFLAAIAMVGVLGLLFFIPVYFSLFKTIISDLKLFKRIKPKIGSQGMFMLFSFMIYFLFDLLKYFYWFLPVSLFTHADQRMWYIFLAIFYGARRVYMSNINIAHKINYINNK